jgi:hypothetical protein
MKKQLAILSFSASLLLTQLTTLAQDTIQTGAAKKISHTNETADNLYGKKIQQESLVNNHAELLDTIAPKIKKNGTLKKRKHS